LPSTSASRGVGATSTDSRNPSRRSSMIEMFAKIDAKSTTSVTAPGKKNSI
jgi:hypothetical protein